MKKFLWLKKNSLSFVIIINDAALKGYNSIVILVFFLIEIATATTFMCVECGCG